MFISIPSAFLNWPRVRRDHDTYTDKKSLYPSRNAAAQPATQRYLIVPARDQDEGEDLVTGEDLHGVDGRSGTGTLSASRPPAHACTYEPHSLRNDPPKRPGESNVRRVVATKAVARVAHARDGVVLFRRGRYGRTAWLEADTYKFVFVPEGRYGVEVCDHDVGVAPGQFVVLNPHDRHRHLGLSGTKLLVEVRPEAMSEAAAALGRPRPPRFRQLRSSDGLLRAWARDWAADAGDGRDLDPAEIVVGLALRLIELQHGPPSFRASAAVTRGVELINERYAERLTIDVLAAAAGMERFAFAHAFRRETGLAPHAYLRERRLAAAAAALDGDKPIIEVAFDSGFGSISSFNRAFRAGFGVAPSRYRQLRVPRISRAS